MSSVKGLDVYEPVLQLGDEVNVFSSALSKIDHESDLKDVLSGVDRIVQLIVDIFAVLKLSMRSSVMKKIAINELKYAIQKVKCDVPDDGRTIKKHGFGQANRLLPTEEELSQWRSQDGNEIVTEMSDVVFKDLRSRIARFSRLRGWMYSPRGLALSLRAEYGEVCGCLEYVDLEALLHARVESKLVMELADVFIYCTHTRSLIDC